MTGAASTSQRRGLHRPAGSLGLLCVVVGLWALCTPALDAAAAGSAGGTLPDSVPAPRDLLPEVRSGLWVEVRGRWSEEDFGRFLGERLEIREPGVSSELWGTARPVAGRSAVAVLGRLVEIGPGTRWSNGEAPGDLASIEGQRLRVVGERVSRAHFYAEEIDVRRPGVDRLIGRIDSVRRTGRGLTLRILGFEVEVPLGVRQRVRTDDSDRFDLQSSSWRVPPRPLRSASIAWEDPDDFFGGGLELRPTLRAELQQEVLFASRRNPDLDARDDLSEDDRDDASHQLRARLSWQPSSRVFGLLDLSHRLRRRDTAVDPATTQGQARLRQAWVLLRDVGFGFDVQVGRQDIDEPREWLFDDNLDGVRLFRRVGPAVLQASWTRSFDLGLEGVSSRNRSATNTILYLSNRGGPRHLAGYVVHREFEGRAERATHQGLRAFGRFGDDWRFWSELSLLTGERSGRPIEAWGTDLGVTWRGGGLLRPQVTLGWAQGQGDGGGSVDQRFRQTGLHDNNARLSGGSAVRYYGELFAPELSNLRIATLGLSLQLARRTTLELLGHQYRQEQAARRLTNTGLERRPNGVDPDLGWELDAVLSLRRFRNWDIELTAAWFQHGAAFAGNDVDDATMTRIQVRYRY